jgi:hypothetical protein
MIDAMFAHEMFKQRETQLLADAERYRRGRRARADAAPHRGGRRSADAADGRQRVRSPGASSRPAGERAATR